MADLTLGFDSDGRPLRLDDEQRRTHAHIIGSSGSGKSKFLEHLMRQDLQHRQGFCLIDPHGSLYQAVLDWAAHQALDRKIILLDLSKPEKVVSFNPFQRAPAGELSVQIDRRITATMHAWGVDNTDQTPTLERMLRLIYAILLEHNLGLPQAEHLIDFGSKQIRAPLIEALGTPFIQREWKELQLMKPREWRDEILSAKNRLGRLLTSPTLARVMGLPGRSINLSQVIEDGSFLLVNLAASDYLSHENARVFGALLVNEFFEVAMRRKVRPSPSPYYLYLDEFQNFVSPAIAGMLDEIRKFGIFLTLAHQRFGQLDEDITDAVLTNCRIKAVFGGLRAESAEMMARELFIGKLDPMKIKAAIYQTKFWPVYGRDKVYTHGTSHGTSSSHSSSTGHSDTLSSSLQDASSQAYFYDNWFSLPQLAGARSETTSRGTASQRGSSSSWAESSSDGESSSESESVADVPIFIPVPFQELSSVQFARIDEQLHEMTAALKEQFPRHCFIKVHHEETEPLLVPKVEDYFTTEENLLWYRDYQLKQLDALPAASVDQLLEAEERKLLGTVEAVPDVDQAQQLKAFPATADDGIIIDISPEPEAKPEPLPKKPQKRKPGNIFDELLGNE